MKSISCMALLSVLMPVICGVVEAQATHKVWVDDNDGQNKDVANALRARIGSITRYALAGGAYQTEIDVRVICVQDRGYACSYTISFWSPRTSPMQLQGASGVVSGPTAQETAELIRAKFTSGTTDKIIETAVRNELEEISIFCKVATNQRYCQPAKP